MQELPPYKITPEEGWAKMKPVLDQMMPASRRSRRFLLFWWTSAAIIGMTFASFILFKAKNHPGLLQPTIISTPEIAANSSLNKNTEKQSDSSPANSNENNSSGITNPRAFSEHQSKDYQSGAVSSVKETFVNNSSTAHSKNNSIGENSNIIPARKALSYTSGSEPIFIEDAKHSGNENYTTNENQEVIVGNIPEQINSNKNAARDFISIDLLPLSRVFLVESIHSNHQSFSNRIIPVIKARKNHVFEPYITVAGIVGSQSGLGMGAAIGSGYSLSSRFGVSADVGFRSYWPHATSFGNAADALTATYLNPDPSFILGEKVNASSDYNAINTFIRSISQWQVSAGLHYKINRRFLIEGGCSIGFGTTTKSEYPILKALPYSGTFDPNLSSSFDSYHVIRNRMVSLYGGIEYSMTRHFTIEARWTQGLDHYILNDKSVSGGTTNKRSDYIRGLGLGISYHF